MGYGWGPKSGRSCPGEDPRGLLDRGASGVLDGRGSNGGASGFQGSSALVVEMAG